MPRILLALALLGALASPAMAKRHRTTCVPTYEPGVGPGYFCASPAQRKHR